MERRASGILAYFTRHKTAANLVLVLMIAAGIAAFPRMRAQFFPDIVLDSVRVSVNWDGAGAEDVDSAIVAVLEPALLAVDGVEESDATSREGGASIRLEFEPNYDMARAAEDVQQAVDGITNLPEEADDPVVTRSAWRDRVTDVIITGPVGVELLARYADEFVARLFEAGVTRTTLRGVAAPEVIVEVPSAQLINNDITMRQIADAIAAEAEADPAGDVSGGSSRVRTGVAKRSPEEIAGIVLKPDLTIGDVADIRVEGVDRNRTYYVGPNPAVSVRVDRSVQGDAIKIQATVEQVAAELERTLPAGVKIDLIRTRSEAIQGRLDILFENGLTGLALVLGLLFLFLNARTALWVAAGIPVAMCAAVAIMYAAGLTLNMMSLFALLITLGIVVDDAIVVGEHADFRVRRLGETPFQASENAAIRMSGPVFSATVTTVIAFAGLTVIEGRFGELIADIPFTVITVLIASLIECFVILPNHMAHALTATQKKEAWYDWPSRQFNKGFSWVRDVPFRALMRGVVWARYPVLAGVIVLLAVQVGELVRGNVQWRFFSPPEEGRVEGNFAMAPGASRADTIAQMRMFQEAVDRLGAQYESEFGLNPVAYTVAEIGGNTGRGLSGVDNKDEDLLGSIAIELIDPDLRSYSSSKFVADLQESVVQHPLAEIISFRGWRGGPGGDAIDVQLSGASVARLKEAAEALKRQLAQFGEVSALEDTLSYDKEELILDLTPQGQELGFSIDALGSVLRNRLGGIEAATFPDGPRSAAIRVELPEGELTADFLDRTMMRTPDGAYVPLADIVKVSRQTGFSTIDRENGIRLVSVTGDLDDENAARAAEIMLQIEESILPRIEEEYGVNWQLSGLSEQANDFLSDATLGFGACMIGIYLVLAWIFSSWTRPLLIMAVIPFGLIGAIWGHQIWQMPLSMFSIVGLIGMSGIIINDSIVLVTTVDEYSRERGLFPAIIDGACDRLRPVLLTTLTTVIGLTPLLYEPSSQAQFLKPTVITLVFGLGFGLVLVLLVVPSLLAMQQDVRRQFQALRRAGQFRQGARGVSGIVALVALAVAAWFAATLGWTVVTGALWPGLAALLPVDGLAAALTLFLAGTLVLVVLGFALGALGLLASGRRAT
ncbi:efflux RND transporter permease subunit [Oceanicola sp. 502str15]|uniref:efflux RND transporter permease subunit n=1 Tax=Oceanicola sp. 502str15 TaxID=2696061 RepID=UPI002094FE78|nr:efflux RND transporter permease subunit [Oceanicola sp. 502str15]MCO6384209.1 AcrB/AcrD/AcrF family protein [Oceanicola sp. 502str15]